MTEQNQRPEFNQSEMYEAIKGFLLSKNYLNEAEAKAEGWTLVHNASWTAYAANVWGINAAPVPWNWESVPQQMLDSDFFEGVMPSDTEVDDDETVLPPDTESKPAPLPFEAAGGASAPAPASAPASGGVTSFSVNRNPDDSATK
jgi:hypothetical protein